MSDARRELNHPDVIVVGASGQLGGALASRSPSVHCPSRSDFDVSGAGLRASAVRDQAVVLNCAAYVNVDACEADGAEEAWRVNAFGPGNVARACAAASAKFVHFSTNYVFSGDRPEPYGEDDLPAPRSVYGITKLAGEHAALAYCPDTLVIRTAGLYGLGGNRSKGGNFVERILRAARDQGALQVFADQTLSPTYCDDLAVATLDAVDRGARGLVHLTNEGSCSWHAFTVEILRLAGLADVEVTPTSTVPRPGVARRPANGVLARPRADALGLPRLRPWQDALADYMARVGLAAG